MILLNRTKGVMICEDVREAKTGAEKSRGLIGSNGAHGIVFKTRWGIHTFGMKFPIDVAVLNKKCRIIKMRRELKPNCWFFWKPWYNTVIEVPSRLLPMPLFSAGDELEWWAHRNKENQT